VLAMQRARTELDSTRSNYDSQLKAITEHACQLENEASAKSEEVKRLESLVESLKGKTFFTQE
jgi:predicted nuclease with TOPRIM domain